MANSHLLITKLSEELFLKFSGSLTIYTLSTHQKEIDSLYINSSKITIDLKDLDFIDSGAAIFIENLRKKFKNAEVVILTNDDKIKSTLQLIEKYQTKTAEFIKEPSFLPLAKFGKAIHDYFMDFLSFMDFLGRLFVVKIYYIKNFKNIRYKEIAFEINESGVKALGIIALTSFLIGVVVAYQSAYQLKLYGANIFVVDMLGISMLRELAPLITAIVIAGRSGSAFTAQIGAMKITQELDAMSTMGFDPYIFLVLPRIIALMIVLPILIFVSDVLGIYGGMLVANIDLNISSQLFLDRFTEVVALKHFLIGIIKGPFFAFLIASIGIYRGLKVKDDTQSIGFNTTKSVVEAIFAVIVCDAVFSIAFTALGI